MPRLATGSQKGDLDNTIYEGLEVAGLMYALNSGMLNNFTTNKNLQIALLSGAFSIYSNYII
jgi:hypothetical protein